MKKLKGAAKRILGGLQNRLSKQARFGQSKHEAKQAAKAAYLKEHGNLDGYNPAKVDGIFSIGTMETYRATMQPFAEWCSAHNVKNAGQITEAHAAAYLLEREAAGLSPWTVSRDLSAINKALGFSLSKGEVGLRQRKKSEITRSREETANDRRQFSKYQEQITVAKACGCRRASITKITPDDCVRNSRGQVVGIKLVEKGGKERIAPVLNEYKDRVTSIVDKAQEAAKPLSVPMTATLTTTVSGPSTAPPCSVSWNRSRPRESPGLAVISVLSTTSTSAGGTSTAGIPTGDTLPRWSPPSAGPWATTAWRSFSATTTTRNDRPLITGKTPV